MIHTSAPAPSTNTNQPKPAYVAPVLEYLGKWQALTLQQSVPVEMFQNLKL
jgi:hypothetical protein